MSKGVATKKMATKISRQKREAIAIGLKRAAAVAKKSAASLKASRVVPEERLRRHVTL